MSTHLECPSPSGARVISVKKFIESVPPSNEVESGNA
jgi:hypothetical protein